jgi:hypothetical protein
MQSAGQRGRRPVVVFLFAKRDSSHQHGQAGGRPPETLKGWLLNRCPLGSPHPPQVVDVSEVLAEDTVIHQLLFAVEHPTA